MRKAAGMRIADNYHNRQEDDLHPREKLLGRARLYQSRSETIPLDILVEADQHGLLLTEFDQPPQITTDANSREGDKSHGTENQEARL